MMHPTPERRLQPRIPGITVTQPGEFDAPLVTHIYTCEQLGACQDRADCTCPPADRPTWPPTERTRDDTSSSEAGNVWFMDNHLYDDDGTPEDSFTVWPVTGRTIAAFWALIFIAVLACIALLAAIAAFVPVLLDGPSELDAIQATAASVLDAQAAAAASAHPSTLIAHQDRP